MDTFKSAPFYMRVFGDYALFTDPMTKGGGEKFTYQIPTYQALKGIAEANYWKPTLVYVIDSVKVVKPVRTETKGVLALMKDGKKDLNYYTYLKDVEYLVKYHFIWNPNREELAYDRNEKKHEQILLRSLKRGGRRDVFLGTRECIGHIDYLTEKEYESSISYYDGKSISYGIMFHSFLYPDEIRKEEDENKLTSNFAPVMMVDGRVDFIEPWECTISHEIGGYSIKKFDESNFTTAEDLLEEYEKEGVV